VGVYRLLRGLNQQYQGVTFTGVAIAVARTRTTRGKRRSGARGLRASGTVNTWGNWCAKLPHRHALRQWLRSPRGREPAGPTWRTTTSAYVKTGDLTGAARRRIPRSCRLPRRPATFATLASRCQQHECLPQRRGSADKVMCLSWPPFARVALHVRAAVRRRIRVHDEGRPVTSARTPARHGHARRPISTAGARTRSGRRRTTPAGQHFRDLLPAPRVSANKCHAKD